MSIELNSTKDIQNNNIKYNVIITAFAANDSYINNLIGNAKRIEYKKENLSQVNHQLYKWLATINDRSSNNSISNSSEKSNTKSLVLDRDYMQAARNGDEEKAAEYVEHGTESIFNE